jgi:hypothetical protein
LTEVKVLTYHLQSFSHLHDCQQKRLREPVAICAPKYLLSRAKLQNLADYFFLTFLANERKHFPNVSIAIFIDAG